VAINDAVVRTCLEDLQAEIEAGSRALESIETGAAEIRTSLTENHLKQASLAGQLVRRINELRKSVAEQRVRMHELRQAIRGPRRVP
jgi:predicted RNase H-like nuclease (RuvC/YqgF family)